jgi:hypothetical protein
VINDKITDFPQFREPTIFGHTRDSSVIVLINEQKPTTFTLGVAAGFLSVLEITKSGVPYTCTSLPSGRLVSIS